MKAGDNLCGRFIVERTLGEGGMGTVLLAHDTALDQSVALKVLSDRVSGAIDGADVLRRETRRSMVLAHENIVRIHDFHEPEEGPPFIAMEYVNGPSLGEMRHERPAGVFRWEELKPLVVQVCHALSYSHQRGIAHRDVKPGNVMVASDGRVKVADFGISATFNDAVTQITAHLAGSGTPSYMSPQQLVGKKPAPSDDIYSLGATLYELLTGTPPFHRGDVAFQIRDIEPESLADRLNEEGVKNKIPDHVSQTIMQCLAKAPEQRPESVTAVFLQLELDRSDAEAPVTCGNWRSRILAVGMLAVVGGVALLPWPAQPVPETPLPELRRVELPAATMRSLDSFGYESLIPARLESLPVMRIEASEAMDVVTVQELSPAEVAGQWTLTDGILSATARSEPNRTVYAVADLGRRPAENFVLGFAYRLEFFGSNRTNRLDAQLMYSARPADSPRGRKDMLPFDGISMRLSSDKMVGGFQFWGGGSSSHVPLISNQDRKLPKYPTALALDHLESQLRQSRLVREGGYWVIIVKQGGRILHNWNGERRFTMGTGYFNNHSSKRKRELLPFLSEKTGHVAICLSALAGAGDRQLLLEGLHFLEY